MHLFLGGEILTLSRFQGGRGEGRGEGDTWYSPKDTIGQKKLPEKDQLGVLKLVEKAEKAQGGLYACILMNSKTRPRSSLSLVDNHRGL